MDKRWIEKAHQYIKRHCSFSNVSDIRYTCLDGGASATIVADAHINLPSIYVEKGVTALGVRSVEEAEFSFSKSFPWEAPEIFLRDDFPRVFPHINPNQEKVCPCIYDGSLSELLQQAEWMDGILNQLIDWLEKAASNSLLNYDQGWEPMRIDNLAGFICYERCDVFDFFSSSNVVSKTVSYEIHNELFFVDFCPVPKKAKQAILCAFKSHNIIDKYIPCSITKLSDLYVYAKSIGIDDFQSKVEENDSQRIDDDFLFCQLAVQRPIRLIGSNHNIECLNFVIKKARLRKKKGRSLKRVLPECEVQMLHHIDKVSPELLRLVSGSKQKNDTKEIAILGCGSLGSKIATHLARNGNQPFLCIDKDLFLPHNNARHSLSFSCFQNKAKLVSCSLYSITGQKCKVAYEATIADYSNSKIIIDSTASFSVRSFLMGSERLPPIISTGLYNQGKYGLLLMESKARESRLCDLWAHLYLMSRDDSEIHTMLFSSQSEHVRIGQSCSSRSMIVNDSTISLFAACFSLQIQKILEDGLPETGKLFFMKRGDVGGLSSKKTDVPDSMVIRPLRPKDWLTRLSVLVETRMRELSLKKKPNETGGVLLGSVFLNARIIVITDILDAPPDSVESPSTFVLGTEGLETQIKNIEKKTHGKVTYLGTWHSHPSGGGASETDKNTSARLLFVRHYEPTVCLIWTPNEVVEV